MKNMPYFLLILTMNFFIFSTFAASGPADFTSLQKQMVKQQIIDRGIKDPRVIKAMEKVPRHLFVPEDHRACAYDDAPLCIGEGQTISQPYIVAFMTETLDLKAGDKILEIGTGSGYQAAILAEIVKEVYTIEIIEKLGKRAKATLTHLGYKNVHVKIGDGYKGWPEQAPFDAVIVTCAPEKIPPDLVSQLKEGGRMIIPVGTEVSVQKLIKVTKKNGRSEIQEERQVKFVPMVKWKS
jgi:protein-L-isoaspartate(D-aspartate) O-methyltransferase